MGEKGWLKEILEEVEKDVDKWPAWMRSKELEDIRKISADRNNMTEERFIEIMETQDSSDWAFFKDLHDDNAFLGLQIIRKYIPGGTIIGSAEHDIIYSVYTEELAKAGITEEDVIMLRKLNWHIDEDSLACFV
jgi:hypothetical protein